MRMRTGLSCLPLRLHSQMSAHQSDVDILLRELLHHVESRFVVSVRVAVAVAIPSSWYWTVTSVTYKATAGEANTTAGGTTAGETTTPASVRHHRMTRQYLPTLHDPSFLGVDGGTPDGCHSSSIHVESWILQSKREAVGEDNEAVMALQSTSMSSQLRFLKHKNVQTELNISGRMPSFKANVSNIQKLIGRLYDELKSDPFEQRTENVWFVIKQTNNEKKQYFSAKLNVAVLVYL